MTKLPKVEDETFADFDPEDNPLQVMIWGPPGGGKSVMACTFPEPRILNLDADYGDSIIWGIKMGIIPHKPEDIIRATIREPKFDKRGFVSDPQAMDMVTEKVDEWVSSGWTGTLIVDSMTTFNLYSLSMGTKGFGALKLSHSWDQSTKIGALSPKLQDYKPAKSYCLQLIQMLRTYPIHLVIIAHEHTEENDSGYVIRRLPGLIGSLRHEVPKELGEVWYMDGDVKDGVAYRRLLSQPQKTIKVAKTRMGFLPPEIRNPTYAKLMVARRAFYAGESDEAIAKILESEPQDVTL